MDRLSESSSACPRSTAVVLLRAIPLAHAADKSAGGAVMVRHVDNQGRRQSNRGDRLRYGQITVNVDVFGLPVAFVLPVHAAESSGTRSDRAPGTFDGGSRSWKHGTVRQRRLFGTACFFCCPTTT